jgi:hypothetical protein
MGKWPKVSLKIVATECTGKDLQPGDLFSTASQDYWDNYILVHPGAIGERVYIRTEVPAMVAPDLDAIIYKIEIIKTDVINSAIDCTAELIVEGKAEIHSCN